VLLAAIGLLYLVSIPWYRSAGEVGRLFGWPDWVAVSVGCYVAVALLNCAAWLLTDVPDDVRDDEGDPVPERGSRA
jgi:hypothetical protein